jgi:glutaredoxin
MTQLDMVTVELYGKPDCCLCDDAKAVLRRVQAEVPFTLREIDIEGDPELMRLYGEQVPVVFVGGFKAFKFRVDEAALRRKLDRGAS